MNEEYKVNIILNEMGVTLNELISTFLLSFLDKELDSYEEKRKTITGIGFQT